MLHKYHCNGSAKNDFLLKEMILKMIFLIFCKASNALIHSIYNLDKQLLNKQLLKQLLNLSTKVRPF